MITLTFAEASRPRIVAPPGWTVLATQLVPPGGREPVEITRTTARAEETLEERMAREGDRLAERLPGYSEESLERRSTRAGDVLVRTYVWELDGRSRRGVQLMGAAGALATLPADERVPDDVVDDVARLVAGFAFGAPRGPTGAFSVEELTALAELVGAPSFPGTGDYAFESEESRQAARRALLARRTLRSADGTLEIDPLERRTIETALRPQAVVRIAVPGPEGVERCLVYSANGVSVAHSAGVHGVHQLEALPSPLLPAVVRALTRPAAASPGAGEPPAVSPEELTSVEVVAAQGQPEALSWLEHDGGLWLVERNGDTTALSPASRDEIGERLDALCAPLSGRGASR